MRLRECACPLSLRLTLYVGLAQLVWRAHLHALSLFPFVVEVIECTEVAGVLAVLDEGLKRRHVASHELNERSSRSHAILTVYIERNGKGLAAAPHKVQIILCEHTRTHARTRGHSHARTHSWLRSHAPLYHRTRMRQSPPGLNHAFHHNTLQVQGSVNFVDLAGSERVKDTKADGQVP